MVMIDDLLVPMNFGDPKSSPPCGPLMPSEKQISPLVPDVRHVPLSLVRVPVRALVGYPTMCS